MKKLTISIIGSGYVGLVTGACLSEMGHEVICLDSNNKKINSIKKYQAPFFEPSLNDLIKKNINKKRFDITSDISFAIKNTQITFICVGTPSLKNGSIDLSQILEVSEQIGSLLKLKREKQLLIVKSTVIPGTTEKYVEKIIQKYTKNFLIASNPEFLRQGSAVKDFMQPDRIVIGCKEDETKKIFRKLYYKFKEKLFYTTIINSELIKYTSNYFLATMISFSNEIANICEKVENTDVTEILNCIHLDKRISPNFRKKNQFPEITNYLKAGGGFGGSCLPKDTKALKVFSKKNNVKVPLLDSVIAINNDRTKTIANKIKKVLKKKKRIILVGITFKKGTDDLRDSPSLKLLKELLKYNFEIGIYDEMYKKKPKYDILNNCNFINNLQHSVKKTDCIVVATETEVINNLNINSSKKIILFDTRNCIDKKVISKNFILYSVGRIKSI